MDIDRDFEVGNSMLEANKPFKDDWASVEIVREDDFGDPNKHIHVPTHLSQTVDYNDVFLGYDLTQVNIN